MSAPMPRHRYYAAMFLIWVGAPGLFWFTVIALTLRQLR